MTNNLPAAGELDAVALDMQRLPVAEMAFMEWEVDGLKDSERGWTIDGDFWSKKVYWEGEGEESRVGSYGIEFRAGTTDVLREWYN